MHLPPFGKRLDGDLARLHAGIGVGRAEIGDAVAGRRVAIGGEQRHLRCDAVEGIDRGLRIDGRDHDGVGAGRHQVVHERVLQRRRSLGRILELQLVVRQFALRLVDAGLREFPEIRGGIDDECKLLLFLRQRRRGQESGTGCDDSDRSQLHDVPPI